MSGLLFVVTAASGTGKTSLVKALIADVGNLYVSVSHTTRPPRPGEVDGADYHFVSKDAFLEKMASGDFIEYAEVFGNYYGTSQSAVMAQLSANKDVLLEIDWQGAQQVKRIFPDAMTIFIIPPSKQALRERLSARGQDTQEVIERRLAGSLDEMRQYVNFDYVVVNDRFEVAKIDLQSIVVAARCTTVQQGERHAQLLMQLLDGETA